MRHGNKLLQIGNLCLVHITLGLEKNPNLYHLGILHQRCKEGVKSLEDSSTKREASLLGEDSLTPLFSSYTLESKQLRIVLQPKKNLILMGTHFF